MSGPRFARAMETFGELSFAACLEGIPAEFGVRVIVAERELPSLSIWHTLIISVTAIPITTLKITRKCVQCV